MNRWKNRGGRLCRRAAALFLAAVMCLTLTVPVAGAASTASSTMQPYLDKIVSWGVMRGDINGNLNPDRTITRAEFVTMINRAFGFSHTGTTPFRDVPASAWYAEDVGIAYTTGYINGTTATTFSPASSVTREQAAVILARILMLQPTVGENTDFTDSRQLGDWSRGLISAAVDAHLVSGYADGSFRPKNAITRGAAAILIVNAIGNPIQEAGTYSLGSTWGNVTITASGVTLRDTVIGGNLYISEGVDLGNVTLENVTVLGDIVVSGGGASEGGDDSIILRNVSAQRLVLDNMKNQLVSLRAEGDGRIPETLVRTNAYLIDRTGDSDGLARITLDGREENLSLTLAGNIKEVISAAPKATVNLAAGQAQTITVDETSTGSKLNIASGAMAQTVNLDTGADITGSGDIASLNVNAAGSTVTMLPDQIAIRPGITANINGETMDTQAAAESSADPRLSAGYPKIADLAPTSASARFAANKKGTAYWAVTAVTDGSVDADTLIQPGAYNPKIIKQGSASLKGSGQTASAAISGLTAGGSYYLSAVLVDARDQRSPLKVISFSTPDDTKPDFASGYPYLSKITSTSGQVTVMPTKTCRLYYAVLPKGAAAPTASDFKANAVTGNLGFGVLDVTKNTTYSFNVNSVPLEELKSYDVYLWLTDVDNGQSSAVKKLSFTTVDGTPPVFNTDPTVNDIKSTSVGLYANLNEAGTLYWVVVEHGALYPKPIQGSGAVDLTSDEAKLQVMAGMNALKSGSTAMTANKDVSFNVSGLEAEKTYDLYYVARDQAGNYSDAVEMVEIHTLDANAPTVTQEFTKYNGTDTSTPLPESDVRLVFSEAVQTADTHTALVDLYEKVNQSVGQGQAEADARAAMANALSQAIFLYQVPAGKQPVKVEGNLGTGTDWTIDYRYATITLEEGKTVVTFPAGKAINLKSGATYYFEIQADTIADTSSAFNVMGRTTLDRFTTVFAQVNLSALNENSISYSASGTSEDVTTVPADVSWRLDPVSTEKVDDSIDWDMLIWSDTSVEFQLFCREVTGGSAGSWKLLGTRDITVPDGVTGYRGVSLTRDFLQSGSSNPDFEPLNTLQEDTAYEYAISFTKVAGIADPAPRKGVWSQRVNLKVYVAAGSDNDLGFLTADLTEENWDEALDGGVTNIGLPSDFSLRKQFTDNEAPSFIGGYPEFTPGDSTVEMRLMLDRPGTVYYVVAPMGTVSTVSKDGGINYGTRTNWLGLPQSGAQDEPQPPELGSPDYLNIVNASSNYRNEKIKYGSISCGASVEVSLVDGLDKTTDYTVYFVLQGTSQTYSSVMAYRFSTRDVEKPKITLNNFSPSVNFQTDSTANLDYVLIASNEIPSALKASFDPDTYVDANKLEAWNNYIGSSGKTFTVLTALCTTYSNGYSVFDEFAKSEEQSNIRSTVADLISGTATLGATIAAQGSKSLTQGNNYRQEQNFTSNMTGGTLYYCLASAESPLGSEMSYAGISGVYIPDKTPPTLQSVSTSATLSGANVYSGTVTFVFDEPVYQLVTQNGIDQTPMQVWQTQYSITDDSDIAVRLDKIIGSSHLSSFSCPNEVRKPSSTLTLKFENIPLNTTLVLFDNSFICDANSNSTRQNLTFRLEASKIGLVDSGVSFVQVLTA